MDAKMVTGADRAREMAVFAAVIEGASFSAAGRAPNLTPSAISRTIDRIEARLGVRLLLRTTRALVLTPEGHTYLCAAKRILADLNDAEQAIADQGAPRGRLRVSAALAHGRQRIVPLVAQFVRVQPHIVVDISLTDAVVDVSAGQADVAIRFGRLVDSPLTAKRLGETGRIIVASPDYLSRRGVPQTPRDLLEHDCLNFNFQRAEPVWPFRTGGRDYSVTVKGPIEANNGETLTQLALAGAGITRVGAFSVAEAIADGRLVPLLEAFNPGDREPIHAVFVGGANTPARVRVFVDFLADALAQG